jgi:signal transduction histidine kinase/HD-like signal output (HDOD) protein/ActR/RegA family two-component response regulator
LLVPQNQVINEKVRIPPENLISSLSKALRFYIIVHKENGMTMNSTKILDAVRLPTLSRTLQEILKLESGNPFTLTTNMKRIIEKDPLLSAHILKVANSSFYGFSQQVRTISHAMGLLGVQRIKQIAFSFSIFDYFNRIPYRSEDRQIFHQIIKKSLLQSSLALLIAQRIGEQEPEEFYMASLLNDIGQIILFLFDPKTLQEIYHVEDHIILDRERQRFGITHRELGLAFCLRFMLPEQIALSIGHHTEKIGKEPITRVAHVANSLAELLMQSTPSELPKHMETLNDLCTKHLGIQLSSLSDALKSLPKLLEAFVGEFPELRDGLQDTVGRGSTLVLSLMNDQISMLTDAHKMDDFQKKIAKEKLFLSHMLNLSYYLSSLLSPEKSIQTVFDYFENFITDFSITFLIETGEKNNRYAVVETTRKDDRVFLLTDLPPLQSALDSHGTTKLETGALTKLGFSEDATILAFPIAFNQKMFGFLLLNLGNESFRELDLELSYIQILSNIMANSFQNFESFERLNSELSKKKILTQELVRSDLRNSLSRKEIATMQKSENLVAILPVVFHKLKNKLTPILGYAQILLSRTSDENITSRLSKIERNAEELTQQMNLLRSYFSIEPPPMELINPNKILSRMAPALRQKVQNLPISLEISSDTTVDAVSLNPGQIETLVENMVDNAIEAIRQKDPPEGEVRIKTSVYPEGGFILEVSDSGIGMNQDQISQIWLPFYTGTPERAGLGLSVCHRILDNHQANFEIMSESGSGTTFRLLFPVGSQPQDETETKSRQAPLFTGNPKKLLIIDDETYLLELMKDILDASGEEVTITTCSNSQTALRLLTETSYDLVISDIHMPGVSGLDIYEAMKSRQMENRLLIMTGDPYPSDVAEFLKSTRIPFLKKPFELMDFKQQVFERLSFEKLL